MTDVNRVCESFQTLPASTMALGVVSPESFFAFLTRPSLSTTVVLICFPITLFS